MRFSLSKITIYFESKPWLMPLLLIIITLLVTIQNVSLSANNFWEGHYTFYNNFLIFKHSFSHLLQNKNLYDTYPQDHADLYKYSPTFALSMGLFYYLPDVVGLFIWNSLNVFILYYAVIALKSVDSSKKLILLFYIIFELILSIGNSQSNALLAGLSIFAFNLFEKGKNTQASLLIVIGVFVKIYSILGCLMFLFYPQKVKSLLSFVLWSVLFCLLPLLIIDFSDLFWQYKNWYLLLKADENQSTGMSLFAFTQILLPSNNFKSITLLLGVLVLLTPLLKFKQYTSHLFRLHYLSHILIWMVIFNYKAESPTYIIAVSGIGIWVCKAKKSIFNTILALLTFIFTSMWSTDLVPDTIKTSFVEIKYIKSLFPMLTLFVIWFGLIFNSKHYKEENKLNTDE